MCFGESTTGVQGNINTLSGTQTGLMNQAIAAGLPVESAAASGGIPGFGAANDYTGGTVAQSFAPAQGKLSRQEAQAGIDPNSPEGIQQQTALDASKGGAFNNQMIQNLMTQFQAKNQGAGNLLDFASSENPLSALALMLQARLQS